MSFIHVAILLIGGCTITYFHMLHINLNFVIPLYYCRKHAVFNYFIKLMLIIEGSMLETRLQNYKTTKQVFVDKELPRI